MDFNTIEIISSNPPSTDTSVCECHLFNSSANGARQDIVDPDYPPPVDDD